MNGDTPAGVQKITEALAAPFGPADVKFRPANVSGNRALAMPYLDARAIMDRLDREVGVTNWRDEYREVSGGAVVCRLWLRVGGEWIAKEDVGGQSKQPDEGDRHKAAFSGALKRAAAKWGIGRFLYRLAPQWCDYDPVRKRFTRQPTLPGVKAPPPAPAAREPGDDDAEVVTQVQLNEIRELNARENGGPGLTWAQMAKAAGCEGLRPEDLTVRQFLGIRKLLREEHAPAAAG